MDKNILRRGLPLPIILLLAGLSLCPARALAQQSMYSDYKANHVGDVITILLKENISGRSNTSANTNSSSAGKASGSVSGNISKFLPLFGADASIDYNTKDDISNAQTQLLNGTMTARIQKVEENGDLYITGKRSTEINGEIHTMDLEGYVRSQDISTDNTVPSYRIADAHITYLKKGKVRHRPGFIRKTFFLVLGLALAVKAFK